MLAHDPLQLKAWELGCFLLPFWSAEYLCTVSMYVNFENNIHRVQDTAEFSSNKQKKQNMGNIEKQKQAQRLLITVLGFITEGPQWCCHQESDSAWLPGELKCCCGYIKIVNDFSNEWSEGDIAVWNLHVLMWDVYSATARSVCCLLHLQSDGRGFRVGTWAYRFYFVLCMRI